MASLTKHDQLTIAADTAIETAVASMLAADATKTTSRTEALTILTRRILRKQKRGVA
jgi:hypothetical protein